ncbi:MAG: threonine synthase [Bacteroidia bacterium]|nr:threonine synthase [Bacteroidia bacterium]
MKTTLSNLTALHCWECSKAYSADQINTVASCERCDKNLLLASYDVTHCSTRDIRTDDRSMWRYFPMLPLNNPANVVSLGEGFTPILKLDKTAKKLSVDKLYLKDEALNPTGSFKARGISMAISKAKELGISRCIIPTAGNAGGAMAAYCAKAGMEAVVVMPDHTPILFQRECELFGAHVELVKGLISDCAARVREINRNKKYFDLSTMREPYRLEGKKTMGYEIAEQLSWSVPDVILYPTGGGTGLIGIWKAIGEMIQLGWLPDKRPRMYAVQAQACQPLVETWNKTQPDSTQYKGSQTHALGLAVPQPFAEKLILEILHTSGGKPLAVSEPAMIAAQLELARTEGILAAPEGAALIAALRQLKTEQQILENESVLLLNTGSAYKYL